MNHKAHDITNHVKKRGGGDGQERVYVAAEKPKTGSVIGISPARQGKVIKVSRCGIKSSEET